MIDLHLHTTCSDGTLSPGELLAAVQQAGLTAWSVTDHDNVDAYDDPALSARPGVTLVTGCELSLTWPRGNLHVLAYGIDAHHAALRAALSELQAARLERNLEMVERLVQAGLPVTFAQVSELAGGGQIGRPHMAQALMQAGLVQSVAEAFERYLGDDSPLYVPRRDLAHQQALDLVHAAGGAAVLAHPYQTGLSESALSERLAQWAAMGLDGLEVWYSRHSPSQVGLYRELALRHGLAMTAGSDFHGATKPDIAIGQLPSGVPAAAEMLDGLAAAWGRWRG